MGTASVLLLAALVVSGHCFPYYPDQFALESPPDEALIGDGEGQQYDDAPVVDPESGLEVSQVLILQGNQKDIPSVKDEIIVSNLNRKKRSYCKVCSGGGGGGYPGGGGGGGYPGGGGGGYPGGGGGWGGGGHGGGGGGPGGGWGGGGGPGGGWGGGGQGGGGHGGGGWGGGGPGGGWGGGGGKPGWGGGGGCKKCGGGGTFSSSQSSSSSGSWGK